MPNPNILLITTDQHNAEILGCAGNPVVRTPHLDRLAAEGMLFTQAYTPYPACTPARTALFTAQSPERSGVRYNINLNENRPDPPHWTGLSAEATAFPEVLAGAGYATALFGKLHARQAGTKNFGLQHTRLAEGKGQFVAYGTAPDDYRRYLREKGYPDSAWRTWEHPDYPRDGRVTTPLPLEDTIDVWTATEAVRWLERVEQPFFAWVSFSGPHTPWDPPAPYDTMYRPDEIPFPARRAGELEEKHPSWVDCLAQTIPSLPPRSKDASLPGGIERAYSRFSDEQVRAMLAAYYGQISLIDAQVGRVLQCLEERGCREETLVVFTTDHGDYLGNNWAFFKYGALYDSLARLPFIVSWPGHAPAGTRCDELVSLLDLAPTFLDAAGLAPVDLVDGMALQPLLQRRAGGWRRELVLGAESVPAVIGREWKYFRWKDGFEELYHRREDPHDLYNRARDPACASIRREMAARLTGSAPAQ